MNRLYRPREARLRVAAVGSSTSRDLCSSRQGARPVQLASGRRRRGRSLGTRRNRPHGHRENNCRKGLGGRGSPAADPALGCSSRMSERGGSGLPGRRAGIQTHRAARSHAQLHGPARNQLRRHRYSTRRQGSAQDHVRFRTPREARLLRRAHLPSRRAWLCDSGWRSQRQRHRRSKLDGR